MIASVSQMARRKLLVVLAIPTAFFLFSFDARSQELPPPQHPRDNHRAFELRTGILHSDNVLRTSSGEIDGTIYSTGLAVDVDREGRRLDVIATGDLDWMNYPSNTFASHLSGYLDGKATFDIVPERFLWRAEDTFGQQVIDAFASITPDTIEDVNYFSTGPQLTLRLGGNMSVALNGDYSIASHENSDLNNDRYGGGIALVRELSRQSALSLNATTQRVFFDAASVNADYDQREFFLAYVGGARRALIRAELGYSIIDRGNDQFAGLLARIHLERQVSGASRVGVYLSRQLSDAGDVFRTRLEQSGSTAPLELALAAPFQDRTVGVWWTFEKGRTRAELGGSRTEERYEHEVAIRARTLNRFNMNLRRRLGPRLSLRLEVQQEQQEFDPAAFRARDIGAGVALEREVGHHLAIALRYNWHHRTSSSEETEFSERLFGVSLFFRPARR